MSNSQHAAKDTKSTGKQTRPEAQPEQVQAGQELEALGLISKTITPADLPSESNAHKLRQASMIQLQRTLGNRYVQNLLTKQTNRQPGGDRPKEPQAQKATPKPEPQVAQPSPGPGLGGEIIQRQGPSAGAN